MASQEDHVNVSLMIAGLISQMVIAGNASQRVLAEQIDGEAEENKIRERDGAEDSEQDCECDGSDCSECGDVTDDEPSPVVHEMNHKDEWKLVMKRGCPSVYKNGKLIYQQKEPCRSSSSTGNTFILHQLVLSRPAGFRGEVRYDIMHNEYLNLSEAKYKADFKLNRQRWLSSPDKKALKPFFEAMSVGKTPITNIVCLCLGSLQSVDDKFWKSRKLSQIQFAVLLTIKNIIEKSNGGEKIKCVAQDPDFSLLDKKFIALHGIEVVEDPQGFAAIDEGTLVFQMGSFTQIAYVMSRGPRPAAFIQNKHKRRSIPSIRLHRREARNGGMTDGYERIRTYEDDSIGDMMKGCDEKKYPNGKGYASDAMEGGHVYWRRA